MWRLLWGIAFTTHAEALTWNKDRWPALAILSQANTSPTTHSRHTYLCTRFYLLSNGPHRWLLHSKTILPKIVYMTFTILPKRTVWFTMNSHCLNPFSVSFSPSVLSSYQISSQPASDFFFFSFPLLLYLPCSKGSIYLPFHWRISKQFYSALLASLKHFVFLVVLVCGCTYASVIYPFSQCLQNRRVYWKHWVRGLELKLQ